MKKSLSAVVLCAGLAISSMAALPQAAREATIEPETKARIVLQSHINSKLNEPGDPVSAVLEEPGFVIADLGLPRGTRVLGRGTEGWPAGPVQKNGKIAIIFDRGRMP